MYFGPKCLFFVYFKRMGLHFLCVHRPSASAEIKSPVAKLTKAISGQAADVCVISLTFETVLAQCVISEEAANVTEISLTIKRVRVCACVRAFASSHLR